MVGGPEGGPGGAASAAAAAAAAATAAAAGVAPHRKKGGKHGRSGGAVGAFRAFLEETWGVEALGAGAGVLDVAGGKGQLSFELLNTLGIPCTVVDPRELELSRWVDRFEYGRYGVRPPGSRPALPRHIRSWWERALWEGVSGGGGQGGAAGGGQGGREGRESARLKAAWNKAHNPMGEEAVADKLLRKQMPEAGLNKRARRRQRKAGRGPTSAFRGVRLDEASGLYAAVICSLDGARQDLGLHQTELEAAQAYDAAALELHGTSAIVNLASSLGGAGSARAGHSGAKVAERAQGARKIRAPAALRCFRCGPTDDRGHPREGGAISQAEEEDGVSGYTQHKFYQCPWPGKRTPDKAAWYCSEVEVLETPEAVREVLSGCSVVLGLHPDQATGDIVDYALEAGKPFAVVPCCTFHKLFTDRRLPDGRPVKSYEGLVEWLLAKDPDIRLGTLPTKGRNQVVYRI